LNVANQFPPSKIYHGQTTSQPTVRHFVNKFPMFLASDTSSHRQRAPSEFKKQTELIRKSLALKRQCPFLYNDIRTLFPSRRTIFL